VLLVHRVTLADNLGQSWKSANAGRAGHRLAPFRAEPDVRIHFPPADSPSLFRSHFRASRTRAFPAGVRGSLDDGVSRDAAAFPLRVNRRQCLCRAIFQYRSGNATTVRTKLGVSGALARVVFEFGSGSSKAEHDPLVVPGKRQT
jgi:hypothetical protein